jgi:penicillin amidase
VALLLGRRLPKVTGRLRLAGLGGPVTIRRDGFGIPHVEAISAHDAWFALGLCQAQDRTFQLETLLRAGRGTLAELVGGQGLPVDRLSRRIGFHRTAGEQLAVQPDQVRASIEAYARGVNAGLAAGRRPHELALLRRHSTPWTPLDPVAVIRLIGFGLATNWDVELSRLKVLELDGPEALAAVEPAYPSWLAVTSPPGRPAGEAIDRLAEDVAAVRGVVGAGGSNNWALAADRTATGRPLLANDPHLSPTLPPFWYLAHLRTPEWALAGASAVGVPGIHVGHNGYAAWGITNGGADVSDVFIEELGPDGRSVRHGEGFVECPVVEEEIAVRGGEPVRERVLVTPRGPIISPALQDGLPVVSYRAVGLEPHPLEWTLRADAFHSFDAFRAATVGSPFPPSNLVYADVSGTIGWQFAGLVPRRQHGAGLLPRPGAEAGTGWEDGHVPAEEMPWTVDPDTGFVASANNKPVADGDGPWLGADWMDGYRVQSITEALAARDDWDVDGCLALQLDRGSLPWRELRDAVLAAPRDDPRAGKAASVLEGWDGEVAPDSAAAAVFQLFLAELSLACARAKAPGSVEWALGRGLSPLVPYTYASLRWVGHLSRLVRERPEGWFEEGWERAVAGALAAAVARLERAGADGWEWGRVRPLRLRHPLGGRPPLGRVFDLGPIPWGGDTNTVAQASNSPLDPTGDPLFLGTLRAVIDVGEWDRSRFVLAGGQSGNPCSPHYDDQWERWRRGQALPLAFSAEAVREATRATLELIPAA